MQTKLLQCKQLDVQYKILEKVGEGSYGQVFKSQDRKNQNLVAIKRLKMEEIMDEGIPSTTIRELAILKKLQHPNLVRLQDIVYQIEEKQMFLVFDYVQQDLRTFIDQNNILQDNDVKLIIYQILKGVQYLHQKRVLHRDLKTLNILISEDKRVQICDFGLSRNFNLPQSKFTLEIASLYYRAPEIMLGDDSYSTAIDIWAVGCVLGELLTKQVMFQGNSQIDQLFKMFSILGTPSEENYFGITTLPEFKVKFPKFNPIGISQHLQSLGLKNANPQVIDLLKSLLILDPNQRPSATDALLHPYFDSIRN